MNHGWIKLHRCLRDNPYMKKPAYRAIWIELLLEAQHDEKKILWKGEQITLNGGQLTCGLKQLSQWTGVPKGTCERVLKCFKNENMIEIQTSNLFSLITVLKWDSYQESETGSRRERETNEKQVRTPKECKNEKKERSIFIVPKISEIQEYMNSLGLVISEAEKFFNYHETKGWIVGKNKMKNWKSAVVTWKANYDKWNKVDYEKESQTLDVIDFYQKYGKELAQKYYPEVKF